MNGIMASANEPSKPKWYTWVFVSQIKCLWVFEFFKIIYLFIFREMGRQGEREGEKHWCARDTSISCLSHAPNWGPGLQPRHIPWLGIELATFPFADQCSIHWATPPRAGLWIFKSYFRTYIWNEYFKIRLI